MPSQAEAITILSRALGAEVYAYSDDGTWICKPLDVASGESHSLMFHRGEVADLEQHAAHHAAGVDPTRYVPHTHKD